MFFKKNFKKSEIDAVIVGLGNPESKYDLKFNTINNIESAEQVLLIGDEYKLKDLEKNLKVLSAAPLPLNPPPLKNLMRKFAELRRIWTFPKANLLWDFAPILLETIKIPLI